MPQTVKPPVIQPRHKPHLTRIEWPTSVAMGFAPMLLLLAASACKPDDAPLKAENETLRKQLARQESVLNSLQDGTKVMQQQIDLLNQELRDAKKETQRAHDETERVRAEAKEATLKFEAQVAQTKKLSAEVQRTAAAQAANLRCTTLCRDDSSNRPISMAWSAISRSPVRSSSRRLT